MMTEKTRQEDVKKSNTPEAKKDVLFCPTCKKRIEDCPFNGRHPLNS
jgi:hypothetical protein